MKIVLISQDESIKEILTYYFMPRGIDVINYRNPVKAIDNIEELNPEIVCFDSADFPRHWKPFIQVYFESQVSKGKVFILLTGEIFLKDEAAKASHLGVNGIVNKDQPNNQFALQISEIVTRHINLNDERNLNRYIPGDYDTIEFIVSHPHTNKIITGQVIDITNESVAFKPDTPQVINDLNIGNELNNCSIQVDTSIFNMNCKIIRTNTILVLQFVDFSEEGRHFLNNYLENRINRILKVTNK